MMEVFRGNYLIMSFVLVALTFLMDSHLRSVQAQSTTPLLVQNFTDLSVNGTKVWVILAAVGGVVGAIILLLLILVCCAFARRGSKVSPPGTESGSAGYYVLDPDRFPSIGTQTEYHPGFSKITPRVDRATMTKRSMWTPAPQPADEYQEPTSHVEAPEPIMEEDQQQEMYNVSV